MSDREVEDVQTPTADPPPTGAFETVIAEAPQEPLLEASIVASRAARRTERRSPLGLLLAGWDTAALWAGVAALGGLAAAEAVAWLGAAAGHSDAPASTVFRAGQAVFLWFHGVGITLSPPAGGFGGPGAAFLQNVSVTLSLTFMTGTLLVVVLLAYGGRRVATAVGGPAWIRGLHGAKVALPYGVLCLLLALTERFTLGLPGSSLPGVNATRLLVQPDFAQALLWPLLLGLLAGFVGGLRSSPEEDASPGARLLRGAVGGAIWMLAFALALSFLGLLVLAAVHPDATRAYLDGMFGSGTLRGLALLALNLLALPNLCVWLLVPAMGSCVGGHVTYGGSAYSSCLISYGHVATRAALRGIESLGPFATDPRQLPAPPAGYLGFMAIPLTAAILGGYVAARRAAAAERSGAAGAGVLAGAGFGLLVVAVALLASLVVQVHGVPGLEGGGRPLGTATLWIGPAPLQGGLFGLAWGILGGSLGGLLAGASGDIQTIRVDTGFG
jgi:hypothetical protein